MNPNKLICLDLDGTLLNDAGAVSKENQLALKKCLDLGFFVSLITGRPHYFAEAIVQEIDERIDVISYNGACYRIDNEQVVHHLESADVQYILKIVRKYELTVYFKTSSQIFTNDEQIRFGYQEYDIKTIKSISSLKDEEVIKVIVLEERISKTTFNKVVDLLKNHYSLSYYDLKGFELVVQEATKGIALKNVMSSLGVLPQNTYVFGDEANDLSMFEIAGNSIAPANAIAEIRKEANFVSKDNNHSSVAYALKYLNIIN